MIRLLVVALALASLLAGPAKAADPITGRPNVSDGSTVRIGNTRIRFFGNDTPEKARRRRNGSGPCHNRGTAAKEVPELMIGGGGNTCQPTGADVHDDGICHYLNSLCKAKISTILLVCRFVGTGAVSPIVSDVCRVGVFREEGIGSRGAAPLN